MTSIEIVATIRVPDGTSCNYPGGPCDHMDYDKKTGKSYCSAFQDVELINIPGTAESLKCGKCLKACREANAHD